MQSFPKFEKKYGPGEGKRDISAETISKYESKLPRELTEFWKANGLCSYINGLFIMINPEEFEEERLMWIGNDSNAVIFARDAFGDLFAYSNGGVDIIFVQYGKRMRAADSFIMFFEFNLVYKNFIETSLDGKFYKDIIKKLGIPNADECFGFFPALALGGSGTLDTVKKVKLKEHLAILYQLLS